jgi:hypothetical protein
MRIVAPCPVYLRHSQSSFCVELLHCAALLTPPQLRLGRFPFVKLASSTLYDCLPSEGLPCLPQMAVLEVFLEFCDVGAEAVVGEGEGPGSGVFGLATFDLCEERDVGGILREHRNEVYLLLVAETRPCCGLEEHVVDIGFCEAARGVGSDVDRIKDFSPAFRCW